MMEAWSLYSTCVNHQVHTKESKNKIAYAPYPTGFNFLPYAGNLMDQPYRLMEFFDIFLHAERAEFYKPI